MVGAPHLPAFDTSAVGSLLCTNGTSVAGTLASRPESEHAHFFKIMQRHPNWAGIVALVAGGQEINRGKRDLAKWRTARLHRHIATSGPSCVIAASDIATGPGATARHEHARCPFQEAMLTTVSSRATAD